MNQPMPMTTTQSAVTLATLTREDWRRTLAKTPVPKGGCFHAKRPSAAWEEVPCTTNHRDLPIELPRPPGATAARGSAGSGGPKAGGFSFDDYDPFLQSGSFSWAEGSFFNISGLQNETDTVAGSNAYSLQLNSNASLPATLCASAANPSECYGWEQFVYATANSDADIFIQYWVINYGKTCPNPWGQAVIRNSQTGATETDCFQNSQSVLSVPAYAITDLPNLSMTAIAGTTDTLVFSSDEEVWAIPQAESTAGISLAGNWKVAEYNVFGFNDGSVANFNCVTSKSQPVYCTPTTNATINVQILVDNATPTTSGPSVDSSSTTGESSNMYLASSACSLGGEIPGIQFLETTNQKPPPAPGVPRHRQAVDASAGLVPKQQRLRDLLVVRHFRERLGCELPSG
jgi:hypothetical protein